MKIIDFKKLFSVDIFFKKSFFSFGRVIGKIVEYRGEGELIDGKIQHYVVVKVEGENAYFIRSLPETELVEHGILSYTEMIGLEDVGTLMKAL